jgi:hypothetical protein
MASLTPQFVEPDDALQTLIIRDPASTQASYAKRHGVQATNRTVGAPDGAARASLADDIAKALDVGTSTVQRVKERSFIL